MQGARVDFNVMSWPYTSSSQDNLTLGFSSLSRKIIISLNRASHLRTSGPAISLEVSSHGPKDSDWPAPRTLSEQTKDPSC
jgi:hypothetical protein